MLRYRIIIRGDVQGVGYRFFAAYNAMHSGICGWVRNKRDRTVEIEAEGREQDLKRYLETLRRGPEYARVDSMDVRVLDSPANYTSFRVEWDE